MEFGRHSNNDEKCPAAGRTVLGSDEENDLVANVTKNSVIEVQVPSPSPKIVRPAAGHFSSLLVPNYRIPSPEMLRDDSDTSFCSTNITTWSID